MWKKKKEKTEKKPEVSHIGLSFVFWLLRNGNLKRTGFLLVLAAAPGQIFRRLHLSFFLHPGTNTTTNQHCVKRVLRKTEDAGKVAESKKKN